MIHRDFTVYEPAPGDVGPTFNFAGEPFQCLPDLPAGAFLQLPYGMITIDQAYAFILRCLVPNDRRRFAELVMVDPNVAEQVAEQVEPAPMPRQIVRNADLHEVVKWLLGTDGAAMSPFALVRAERSSNGVGTTGPSSSTASSGPAGGSTI